MKDVLRSNTFLAIEFFILCILVPGYIIFTKSAPFMFAFLWGAALYCYIILRVVYHDHWNDLWKWRAVSWRTLKPILGRWLLACAGMTAFIYLYDPDRIFYLVNEKPFFILIFSALYPIISALPQEFIFCSFFFERYEKFFGKAYGMVIASAVTFAYAHVLYINMVAPSLSLIAGAVFALTYLKTRSLALVTIEHGLYGNYLFIVGLGWYFYGGSVVQ